MQPVKLCVFAAAARQASGALRGLGHGGIQIWHGTGYGGFVQVAQNLGDARNAPFFESGSATGTETEIHGFCEMPNNVPACTSMPCCCWSTFGEAAHPAYPNSEEAANARRCMNPASGYVFVTQPGATHDDGQMAFIRSGNTPVYDGRDLCCLMGEGDPIAQSMIDPNNGASSFRDGVPTSAPTIPPLPTPEAPAPPPPLVMAEPPAAAPGPAQALIDQDYETMQMESAARSHAQAAESLGEASSDLGSSVAALGDVQHMLASSPVVARKRAHVAHMRSAIASYNNDRASQGDFGNMLNVSAPR